MAEDRLISANEFKQFLCGCCNVLNGGEPCEPAECNVMLVIDQQPTIDAVKVVRCGSCRYRHTRHTCAGRPMDFYCADGER